VVEIAEAWPYQHTIQFIDPTQKTDSEQLILPL